MADDPKSDADTLSATVLRGWENNILTVRNDRFFEPAASGVRPAQAKAPRLSLLAAARKEREQRK
jgi:hypothetical protein